MRGLNIWKELGLEPTQEKAIVKKAYAQKLKSLDLATDREAFQRLRTAFELALAHCEDQGRPQEDPDQDISEGPEESQDPPDPSPERTSKSSFEPLPRTAPAPDPREEILRVADGITDALMRGQEREAAHELEKTSELEDFQRLEARWFLAGVLINRLYQFKGRMPVAFCLRFVKHFGLKDESKGDFSQMEDMVYLLLQIAEIQRTLAGVKKRKVPWPWLDALQRIQLPYLPWLTWLYGLSNKSRQLCLSMEGIVEQFERINPDTSAFGIDPRMLAWWKGRLDRWFHPFKPVSIVRSYWFWYLMLSVLLFTGFNFFQNKMNISDGALILVFLFLVIAIPVSFFRETSVYWGLKRRKSSPRLNLIGGVLIGVVVVLILVSAIFEKDAKTLGGIWPVLIIIGFRFLLSKTKK